MLVSLFHCIGFIANKNVTFMRFEFSLVVSVRDVTPCIVEEITSVSDDLTALNPELKNKQR